MTYMDVQSIQNLQSRFVSREVGNELILVPLTNNVAQMNSMFTLNETGKFIWENLAKTSNINELVAIMTCEFDIDPETARIDIQAFLKKLETVLNK